MPTPRRLPDLLAPYRTAAIAEGAGVQMAAVRAWRKLEDLPRDAMTIQRLAAFLGVEVAELLEIIAAEQARRAQAVA